MPRVLLVDTNFSSAPIHDYLGREGCEVFVMGGNPNDFLAKTSENYIPIDYSNVDDLRREVEARNIDFVVPGCNDRSYHVSSVVAQERGLAGIDRPEVSEAINSKEKFRELAGRLGLPIPRVLGRDDPGRHGKVVVKPVDAYSGRGVTIVDRRDGEGELEAAIERARSFSRTGGFLIEEFVSGQLYSHSAFIEAGRVIEDFIVEEHCTANQFVVDTSRVVFDFPEHIRVSLREDVRILAAGLALGDGLVHTQFIRNGDDYWLIEVTRRCPGDLYSRLIELSTGFNYVENYVRPFLGKKPRLNVKAGERGYVIRHTVSQREAGRFLSMGFKVPVLIETQVPLLATGEELQGSPKGRASLLFMRAASEVDVRQLFDRVVRRDLYWISESI